VTSIDGEEPEGMAGWMYRVDYISPMVGADQFILDDSHQEVLWYYGEWDAIPLKVEVDNTAPNAGDSFTVTVSQYDNALDEWYLIEDATVYADTSYTTDENGEVDITIYNNATIDVYVEKDGYIRSNCVTVTVLATPPMVTTSDASDITTNSATLNGNLDDLGTASTVDVSFEWGLDTSYGNESTPQAIATTGPFSFNLSDLLSNTTYHFRAKAVGDVTSYGLDNSFATTFDSWNYDADEDGVISKAEAITAVVDYFDDTITKEQALEVIALYFA